MKVLFFISSIDTKDGGPSRSVPMLAKGLAEIGIDVVLMTFRSKDMNIHSLQDTAVILKVLDSETSYKSIKEYIASKGFDIIQLQSIWSYSYHQIAKIARSLKIPYIITPRGMLEPWSLAQSKWKKMLAMLLYQKTDLQNASCIFTTADMEAKHVHDLGINVPCSVIPNGIETEGYPCRASKSKIKKQVLFLSRIHIKKGIELLLDAWKRIHDIYPEWLLMIVGNGEEKYVNSLKSKIKDLELNGCVQISEPVFGTDKIAIYQSSSLFCLPSYSENFGMVVAEAMSCGVPVITTTNCPWNILNETNTGWCIDLSIDNLEKTLREAISMDSDELYEKGQQSSKLVFENFNYKNVAKRTNELYKWIIEGGKTPEFVKLK